MHNFNTKQKKSTINPSACNKLFGMMSPLNIVSNLLCDKNINIDYLTKFKKHIKNSNQFYNCIE